MPKPSILIVPGSFAPADIYDPVVKEVAARGYEIRAVQLPSVGLKPEPAPREPPTMYEDAALVARQAAALADEGKDVVLVAQSYGGAPATESVRGLSRQARRAGGKEGGVARLAYASALAPELGVAAGGVLADARRAAETRVEMEMDDMGWLAISDMKQALPLMLSDLPLEEAEAWADRMSTHSSTSFANELTYAGYKDVPVSYLICERDVIIPPERQRGMIEMIERVSGNKVDVSTIQSGHCVNITELAKWVDWIVEVAEKSESRGMEE